MSPRNAFAAAALTGLLLTAVPALAGPVLYTIGADPNSGAPVSLISMDAAGSPASVSTVVSPLGDGSIGFNGGLTSMGSTLYAIGNDSNGYATLYSFTPAGTGLAPLGSTFNTIGPAAGFIFQNGLTAAGGTLYAVGFNSNTGSGESLFSVGGGSATVAVSSLQDLGGAYSGLAWAGDLGRLFGVIIGGTSIAATAVTSDFLVSMNLDGSNFTVVGDLSALDGSNTTGIHTGGLLYTGGGNFYTVATNPGSGTGQLESIALTGPSAAVLYDTNAPLLINHGLADTGADSSSVPEPSSFAGLAGSAVALALLAARRRRRGLGRRAAARL